MPVLTSQRGRKLGLIGTLILALMVGLMVGVPIWSIIQSAFREGGSGNPGAFTLDHFVAYATSPGYLQSTFNTIVIALVATLVAMACGFLSAWLLVRTDVPWKPFITIGNIIPYLFPTFLGALGWNFLAAPDSGLLNRAFVAIGIGGDGGPFSTANLPAIGLVLGLYLTPIVYVICASALLNMDGNLEDAARVTGSNELKVFGTITLRLMVPSIVAAGVLVGGLAVENYGVPRILGQAEGISVLMTRIAHEQTRAPGSFGPAGVVALLMLILVALLAVVYGRVTRAAHRYVLVGGKATPPKPVTLGKWRVPALTAWLVYFALSIALPFGTLLYLSFKRYPGWNLDFTLDPYIALFSGEASFRSIQNSLTYSLVGATITLILGVAVATAAYIRKGRLGKAIDFVAVIPVAIPGVVLGVALLWFWVGIPLPVYGTVMIIMIVYITKFLPFAVRTIGPSMIQVNGDLVEAAKVTGANEVRSFFGITIPLIRGSLIAGWVLLWLSIIRELGAVVAVYAHGTEVMPLMIIQRWDGGQLTQGAALAVLQAVIALIGVGAFFIISRRMSTPGAFSRVTQIGKK